MMTEKLWSYFLSYVGQSVPDYHRVSEKSRFIMPFSAWWHIVALWKYSWQSHCHKKRNSSLSAVKF